MSYSLTYSVSDNLKARDASASKKSLAFIANRIVVFAIAHDRFKISKNKYRIYVCSALGLSPTGDVWGLGILLFFSFLFLFWSWIILVVGYVYSALGLSPTGDV